VNRKNCQVGFTLVEVLLAVIFVGLALASLVAGNRAFTQANAIANEMSTAEFLTEQIRERTRLAFFENLDDDDFEGTYSPPIDAKGDPLPDFAAYRQKVTVGYVENTDFTKETNSTSRFKKIKVEIYRGTRKISETSWIRAQMKP